MRERLRWEKELLGLYLSEHPMGEVAEQVGQFVNAYSGDLNDESLDGQRVVVGGIVTGIRTVITKAKASMAIVTMEDLQGTIEVVVFPRLYEQTGPTWRDGAILLVAGRVDHKGEEVSLLADLVAEWDDAVLKGPEAFAREVAAGDRGGGDAASGGGWQNGSGNGNGGNGNGRHRDGRWWRSGPGRAPADGGVPRRPGRGRLAAAPRPARWPSPAAPRPDRAGRARPDLRGRPGDGRMAPDRDEDPAVPDEARARIVADATADTPVDAGPGGRPPRPVRGHAPSDRVVGAMETFKALLRDRPGATRVVIHVPGAVGRHAAADGAAPRRRLRLGAGRRGPPPARRGTRGTVAGQRLTRQRRMTSSMAGSGPCQREISSVANRP